MKADILTFCESAALRENRLDIRGCTETFQAKSFPCSFGNICLAYRVRFEVEDSKPQMLRLVFTNEDGKTIFKASNPNIKKRRHAHGGFLANVAIISLSAVVIPQPGEYSLTLLADDSVLSAIPLYCNLVVDQR